VSKTYKNKKYNKSGAGGVNYKLLENAQKVYSNKAINQYTSTSSYSEIVEKVIKYLVV